MNKHLNEAIFELGKADALLAAFDGMFQDFDLLPEERQKANRGAYIICCLRDAIDRASEELKEYSAEARIVDVIHAVRASTED